MRKRHSGKRSLRSVSGKRKSSKSRKIRKLSRKLRKYKQKYKSSRQSRTAVLTHVDHSMKKVLFAKAIARGSSDKRYDSCTCTVSNHMSDAVPFNLDPVWMTPFGKMLGLQSTAVAGTSSFIPFDCLNGLPSGRGDQNFLRHANMYTQYRIKCIRFEYVPFNAVTGRETVFNLNAVPTLGVQPESANTEFAGKYWLVKWPNKSGTFQDFGVNFSGPVGNQRIYNTAALMDPSVVKIPLAEKFVLTWKPKVLGYKTVAFRPLNLAAGAASSEPSFMPTAKKFPWTNIIDNVELPPPAGQPIDEQAVGVTPLSVGGVLYNTQGLRLQMSFPLISCYDSVNNVYDPAPLTWGRWVMTTVFEFKTKRDRAAVVGGQFDETVSLNQTNFVPTGQFTSV